MSNANVSRLGADNLAVSNEAEVRALFQKVFTGEVLTSYAETNIMEAYQKHRHITSGKSAGFNNTGKAKGRQHVPGTEITGQNIRHGETVITIDSKMIADAFTADIDEAMNHYETRSDYAKQLGEALARIYDKQAFRTVIDAARSPNVITNLPGGTELTLSAGYAASSDAAQAIEFADALFAAAEVFETNNVPTDGLVCVISPKIYFQLVRNKDLLNQDWGGLGSYGRAELPMVAGIPLVKSTHIPSQDDSLNITNGMIIDGALEDELDVKYTGDYSKTKALVFTKEASGCVSLMDLKMEQEYDIRRQGTLMVASMVKGMGKLRPDNALEIKIP